ncbi:hypothetical protein [Chryseobacterium arthrosphaerae]|uniref:hypothetical protein n=1 Tax=Chryseobacterium arthrosphaerae TaxID=651561 RepID=UPI0031CDB626
MMKLRAEIEADFETAEKRYPEVLKLILDYTDCCDAHGDEDSVEYKKLEERLHTITGKEMSQFDLWEWWEGDGAENLAFSISLPEPEIVKDLTRDEVAEIVRRLKTFEIPDAEDKTFKSLFYNYLYFGSDFYPKFLKVNGLAYKIELFQRHKDKNGNYFEFSQEEITDQLWNGK